MRQEWMAGIRQMGIFVICAQALIHFRPKGSYEKYMKLLVSVMILAQLFTPIARLLGREGSLSLEERIRWYEEQLGEGLSKTDFSYSEIERILAGIARDALTGTDAQEEVQRAQGEALAEWETQKPGEGRDPEEGQDPEEENGGGRSGGADDTSGSEEHIRIDKIEIEGQEEAAWEQP